MKKGCIAISQYILFVLVFKAGATAIQGAVVRKGRGTLLVFAIQPHGKNACHAHKANDGAEGDNPFHRSTAAGLAGRFIHFISPLLFVITVCAFCKKHCI